MPDAPPSAPPSPSAEDRRSVSQRVRLLILLAAFLGWFFGGVQITITAIATRSAAIDLMDRQGTLDLQRYNQLNDTAELSTSDAAQLRDWNSSAGQWFAWYQCAFLFGAAAGGFIFGRLGDRIGRTRAMAISIIWFSTFTGISVFVQSPTQLLLLRFLACPGIGGTWPNGVALVSEAWSQIARPVMASLIGMAGNLGIFAMATLAAHKEVTPESWRWVMLVGASPFVLGLLTWACVPESPTWSRQQKEQTGAAQPGALEIFGPRYRLITLIGIGLATIPLIGGWGSANWMVPWAGEAGAASGNEFLKANVIQARSITSIVGSFLAGWIACGIGRRRTYFIASLGALFAAEYAFWFTTPTDASFMIWVAILGFFNGVYFGWLPFFLPELFETRIRSTGAGVSFNFGRILTAFTVFVTGATMKNFFGGYAEIGRATSLIFALGMVVILFAPDTSKRNMND